MEDILALKEGDTLIFEQVYNAYNEKLYFYFLKHTGSQLWSEELLQTTFVKLWRYRKGLSADYTLSAQIFRIAKTALIDLMRKERQHKAFMQSYTAEVLNGETYTAPANKEAVQQLHLEIDKLPPVRKKVFMLSRIDGFSHKEISDMLSISPKTVEVHISKALKQLRRVLLLFTIM
ncbi:RNA polymerase sigma factor [Chitinophaga pinensis]|uniref:RNA polymerase, sigma-24 subunit, ECF subfamily n=1 Tax=Chitinophaga pinensis (strain ATCC 43595 / DSM 2588 / LMG 13176 / NBRC 15968 / NCIMB 11800 / UQM 2034) TaxID=485918 RepID=A0A979GB79_CHIPD|nr:sigma-70 family RNA polymerase sigma factor [Chitinophaga pinensis]ACU64066.1 RNA polymerase, sigma-24 subunit, ECF subfamily [Chitinophaga pinensis DSM 2588]